ncbi:DUF481 domain-containing protein [Pseudemcibacter sp.]|uniref:DUF481 domain-containing protein n=1 Tax=Pseudemcibacter sp. TaxID=2943293 RepID=UPI003F694F40
MTRNFCKTALTAGLLCLPMLPIAAEADVTPEQFNLLMTAANKDGGKDFDVLVGLLIAAHPEDAEEITRVAADIRPTPPEPPAEPETSTIPAAEGTIFSDDGAKQFSKYFLPGWDKEIELNALYATGNTSQRSFGAATQFSRETGPYKQTVASYFDYNNSNSVTNQRRYGVSYKNDYSVTEISYVTGFASFEGDSFGAFNKRFTVNAGYGVRAFDNETFKWNLEAGPAVLITKQEAIENYETVVAAYASSVFTWNINDRSDFENATKVFVGSQVVIENKTDYTIKVSGALSGKLSLDVLYNRDAPIDRKNTDVITRVGVLYDF